MVEKIKTSKEDLVGTIDRMVLDLNEKEQKTITGRFGLSGTMETLSAIGRDLKLSRERIRQIEKNALKKLSKDFVQKQEDQISGIVEIFEKSGKIITDDNLPVAFLKFIGEDKFVKNYCRLILVIIPKIEIINQTADLKDGWRLKELASEKIVSITNKIVYYFKREGLPQNIATIKKEIKELSELDIEFLSACVDISNKLILAKNGFIGLKSWPTVNPRNIRDKIYYVLSNAGHPLHFSQITSEISVAKFDKKKVVRATVHNELIADNRFVLIGRGIYALREWGFSDGTVYDVIKNILSAAKSPVSIGEVIALVNKSRKVKRNTIVINLQTKKEFRKVDGGYVYTKL